MLAFKQILAAILFLTIYVCLLFLLKQHLYIGWTWRGFLSDYKVILTLAGLLSPPLLFIWLVYRNSNFHDSMLGAARQILVPPKLTNTLKIEFLLALILGACLIVKPQNLPADMLFHFKQHNWTYAQSSLEDMKSQPFKPELIFALEHYVDAHKRSNGNQFENGQFHRAQRIAVKRALSKKDEYFVLNLMSFAELSKIIYLIEDRNELELKESIELMLGEINSLKQGNDVGLFYLKIGELYLASKSYENALEALNKAKLFLSESSDLSFCNAKLGNIAASLGKFNEAAIQYQLAEKYYPEGHKDVFYSNWGYFLMLDGKYEQAENNVKYALAINPLDWYSHLNLALIYDAMTRYDDAIHNYDQVISQTDSGDYLREAKLLKAYSLLKGKNDAKSAVSLILEVSNRTASNIDTLLQSDVDLAEIYSRAATMLRNTNTHGIEKYISFFDLKATEHNQVSI